jgi:hypothetical protein
MKSRLKAEANGITRNPENNPTYVTERNTIVAIGTFPARAWGVEQDVWIFAKPLTRCSQRLHHIITCSYTVQITSLQVQVSLRDPDTAPRQALRGKQQLTSHPRSPPTTRLRSYWTLDM